MTSQRCDATGDKGRSKPGWPDTELNADEIKTASPPENESTLLDQAISGDTPAVAHIYNKYYKAIYAYALVRVHDSMLAEDIASEVMIRFIEVLNKSESEPNSLRSWLFGVAFKVITDYYRRTSRRQIVSLDDVRFEEPADFSYGPLDIFEQNIQKETLRQAFGQLTRAQKDVLSLRFGASMSLEECAKQLNRSTGSVKVLQYRGLQRLRTLLSTPEG